MLEHYQEVYKFTSELDLEVHPKLVQRLLCFGTKKVPTLSEIHKAPKFFKKR